MDKIWGFLKDNWTVLPGWLALPLSGLAIWLAFRRDKREAGRTRSDWERRELELKHQLEQWKRDLDQADDERERDRGKIRDKHDKQLEEIEHEKILEPYAHVSLKDYARTQQEIHLEEQAADREITGVRDRKKAQIEIEIQKAQETLEQHQRNRPDN